MNSISVSKYMTYNPLFNVSSFLQSTSNHHSPSSTSSTCSSNSSNSFSPNSSINTHTQCLPSSLNAATISTPLSNQYQSNSNLAFNSNFHPRTSPNSTNNSILRLNSPNELQTSLAQAQLAAQMAAVVAIKNDNTTATSESLDSNQTPQLTSLALKQAAIAAALQNRTINSSNASQLLNNNRIDQSTSFLPNASQFSTHFSSSKSSFSPSKNFYYTSLKAASSNSFQQQHQSTNLPNLEIMNLSADQFKLHQTSHLSPQSTSFNGQTPMSSFRINAVNSTEQLTKNQLDQILPTNMITNNLIEENSTEKLNSSNLSDSPIAKSSSNAVQLINLETSSKVDSKASSNKHKTNRQGKSVRKSNSKDEFGFSKVLK